VPLVPVNKKSNTQSLHLFQLWFSDKRCVEIMALENILNKYRSQSRGYNLDAPAVVFPRVLLGPACYIGSVFMSLHNITHIINCAEDEVCPDSIKRYLGKKYVCIGAIDHPAYPILDHCYGLFSQTMDAFLRDPQCKNIYIHCHAGINRSACLILAYIHKTFRISLNMLVDTVARQRPCILSNKGFQKQLLECK
jgi:hypothetical protein